MTNSNLLIVISLAFYMALSFTSCKDEPIEPIIKTAYMVGEVVNSQSGSGLPNATLKFYESLDKEPVFQVRTNQDGYYGANDAVVGVFTCEITADNFYTMTIENFEIYEEDSLNSFEPITMVKVLSVSEGELRIVVNWGGNIEDLDSHLTGPISGSAERFHMYYTEPAPLGSNVNLDLGDSYQYGPETITIYSYAIGTYRFSVYNYSTPSYAGALEIYNSPVTVKVFNNAGLLQTYTAPAASSLDGNTWCVFEIYVTGGLPTFVTKNTYTYFVDESNISKK